MSQAANVQERRKLGAVDFAVSRIGASIINVCEKRLVVYAGRLEARYMRGGRENQLFYL